MRIGLDIRPLLKETTGVGTYWGNLLFSLADIDRSNEYYLFSTSLKDRFSRKHLPPFRRCEFKEFRYPQKWLNFFWSRWGRPRLDKFFHTDLDLTHSPVPLICPTKGKKIITVHDLFFAEQPQLADKQARRLFLPGLSRALHQAEGIVAVSSYVKDMIMKKFSLSGQKIAVIHHGVDPGFFRPRKNRSDKSIREKYSLPEGYIFFIGTEEPRKNIPRLIEACHLLFQHVPDTELVIAGKTGRDTPAVQQKIKDFRISSRVKRLPYLPREEVPALYRGARLFVFPSLCEGFGLPLLEAAACRVPVAASRAPALPETGGDAALYFDPLSPEDMARVMRRGLEDDAVREQLIQAGGKRIERFSWNRAARLTQAFHFKTAGAGPAELPEKQS